ncbi:piggyBac transposable element-derived protein 4-like [Anthonomus grandis grandis]|uniref:piggyBac transposable element-derived protein 4-like n=1 Tax=Anthonomus grandis grandis TaxID=2921223 RepID=UPI00216596A7|nr:piggyBac transposable element-derived protein 4-like [Anthonomus grandis grandis]
MVSFKGRSSLKQYMPQKPVKRGIKLWSRCDAKTGYTYDANVYCGKDDVERSRTLGRTVVKKLCETIQNPNVVLAFERFFTPVRLMDSLQYPAVGTAIIIRKDMPKKFIEKRKVLSNQTNSIAIKWQDTKQVILFINCHTPDMTCVKRKDKTGQRVDVQCPTAIAYYNEIMGGVDLTDQMSAVYDFGRKSCKWRKKVFYRLLMIAVVNSWVIYNDLRLTQKKIPLLEFLFTLSEDLIEEGQQQTSVKLRRNSCGRSSK